MYRPDRGWINASTLEEFETGIQEGKYAGNVPEDKKRYGSYNTVGVDCSGLLTRCWDLPKKIATRDIPEYIIIDATRSTGKVSQRKENVAELFGKGYQIYRKK